MVFSFSVLVLCSRKLYFAISLQILRETHEKKVMSANKNNFFRSLFYLQRHIDIASCFDSIDFFFFLFFLFFNFSIFSLLIVEIENATVTNFDRRRFLH